MFGDLIWFLFGAAIGNRQAKQNQQQVRVVVKRAPWFWRAIGKLIKWSLIMFAVWATIGVICLAIITIVQCMH